MGLLEEAALVLRGPSCPVVTGCQLTFTLWSSGFVVTFGVDGRPDLDSHSFYNL